MSFLVKCKITREIFKNNGYYILACVPYHPYNEELELNNYGNFTICGELSFLDVNKEYELEIEAKSRDKYGVSYKVISVPSVKIDLDNLSYDDSFEMLMSVTSSERIANNIITAYPDFIKLVLENRDDEIDLKKIKGVGDVYYSAYKRMLNEKYKYLAFMNKYKQFQLEVNDCKVLFNNLHTEENITYNLKEKPYYVLIELLNRSFAKADKLLTEIDPSLIDSDQRCEALIMEVLKRNEVDGSSRLNGSTLFRVVKEEYNADMLIPKLKDVAVNSELIYFDEASKDLSLMSTYIAETTIVDFFYSKLANSTQLEVEDIRKYQDIDGFKITDTQLSSLDNLCKYNVSLLIGYSGSGKTSVTKAMISMLDDLGMTYTLVSPTGKASQVFSEATNRKASTIHKKCAEKEINSDVLIVDECSMISLDVFSMLINAIVNENMRIVLVGDSAQLCPIGLGKIFSDLITSNKIPMTMLTEIFRYRSNGSLFVATNLRQGKSFFDEDIVNFDNIDTYSVSSNYKFINVPQEDVFDRVLKEYKNLLDKKIKREDIQIYSPFNVGSAGTYIINNTIQAEFNPPQPNELTQTRRIGNTSITFRLNDLVINKKNDYSVLTYDGYLTLQEDDVLSEDDVEKASVFNGQMGIIREVLKDGLVIQFDEQLLFFNKLKVNDLLLGYCISTHSSQGSSIPYSISVVSKQHMRLLSKELLYVADTRCRKSHIDIGDIDAFNQALTISADQRRNTWLLDLLEEKFN